MRSKEKVDEYKNNINIKNISDEKKRFCVSAFEACIPNEFWNVQKKQIEHNTLVFKKVILKYVKNINKALQKGYGLVLCGSNGVGKTIFLSYILSNAIKKGRSVYYTTLPQLDYDIKRGFDDKKSSRYLELMLTSDFIAIDEIGKERTSKKKTDKTFMDGQIERILKQRCDDSFPVLIGSNESHGRLTKIYGSSVGSILNGSKYRIVQLKDGDYRKVLSADMEKDMGY